jgi:hypothetical protein
MWVSFYPELLKSVNALGWKHLSQSDRIRINREAFIKLTGRDYNDLIKAILEKHEPILDLSRFNSVSLNGIIAIKENNYGTSTHDRI